VEQGQRRQHDFLAVFEEVPPGIDLLQVPGQVGMNAVMNWCVSAGATMVLMPDPRDTEAIVKAIERHKVTLFPGAPAMFNAVNNMSGIKKRDLSSIKACLSGSAPLPADVMERFEELFVLNKISPIQTKRGRAVNDQDEPMLHIVVAIASPTGLDVNINIPIVETPIMLIPTQTPVPRNISKTLIKNIVK
jgi:hypothetical protein